MNRTVLFTLVIVSAAMAAPKVMIHSVENTHCNANSDPSCVSTHENVVIHYNLENTVNKNFVSLFASRDGGETYNEVECKNVTGDIGYTTTGTDKVITWDPSADMPGGTYDDMRIKIMVDEYVPAITQLYMTNVKTRTESPSKVHFRFALRDQCNHAVIVPPSMLRNSIKIYENNVEIDYSESAVFVHNACSNRLKVALVLDFTQSMATIGAIDTMVAAAKRIINQLAVQHSVALVAYHDRNEEPVALLPQATSDKQALLGALDAFVNSGYVPGATRSWDAIKLGLQLLGPAAGFDTVKVLVALTDGRDNSSLATPDELRNLAVLGNTQINVVAFGDNIDNLTLNRLAAGTGGAVYTSEKPQDIEDAFETITHDLSGQYIVTYMSQRRYDTDVVVKIAPTVNGKTTSFSQHVNFAQIYSDDRIGRLYAFRSLTTSEGTFLNVEASHMPRAVNSMRFRIDTDVPYEIRVPWAGQGGVLQGWDVSKPDARGFRTISSEKPAAFADFGFLFNIVFHGLPANGMVIPFEMDTSIYPAGYTFRYPSALFAGDTVIAPTVSMCSTPVVTVNEPASLCASLPDSADVVSWEWDFNGDGMFDTVILGNCPRVVAMEYLYKETGDYRVLLRIKYRYAGYVVDTLRLVVNPDACPGCEQFLSKVVRIPAKNDTVFLAGQRIVMAADYFMGATEVTQGEYAMLMRVQPWLNGGTQSGFGIGEVRPAWFVNWFDAVLFCNARSKLESLDTVYSYGAVTGTPGLNGTLIGVSIDATRNGYRLPTEAEWQYAYGAYWSTVANPSTGVSQVTYDRFFWGASALESMVASYAWYKNNTDGVVSSNHEAVSPGPQPVGALQPNRFGLYDMAGDVWEWTNDRPVVCESPCTGGGETVLRGGSWADAETNIETVARKILPPSSRQSVVGFRVVLNVTM